MAETTGAAPRRARTATAKPAAATKTPAKPAAKPAEVAASEPLKIELVHNGDTKTYKKFTYGERGDAIIVNAYVPAGTARVMVAVIPGEETE